MPGSQGLAVDIFTNWCIGDGFIADKYTTVLLDEIYGWGVDTFDDILENMIKMAMINGDSFAEIIEQDNTLINLKTLDPSTIKIIVGRNGLIKRYEQTSKIGSPPVKFNPKQILHLSFNRVADEVHGTSIYESTEGIIKALKSIDEDMITMVHRNIWPLRIVKVDASDQTKINELTTKYEKLIKNKEILFVPKETIEIETQGLAANSTFNPLPFREVLKNSFYQNIGLPQILLGGAAEFSESSAKIAYVSFTNTMRQLQRYIITQIKNQLLLTIDLELPTSIKNELISDTSKDGQNQQMGFQPSDFTAGVGK